MVKLKFWSKKSEEKKTEETKETELEKAEKRIKYVVRKWVKTTEDGRGGWIPVEGLTFDYPVSPDEVLPALEDGQRYSLSPVGLDGKYQKAIWVINTGEEGWSLPGRPQRRRESIGELIDALIGVSDTVENYQEKFERALTILAKLTGRSVEQKNIRQQIREIYEEFKQDAEMFGYVPSSAKAGSPSSIPVAGQVPWQLAYAPELIDRVGDTLIKKAALLGLVTPEELEKRKIVLEKQEKIFRPEDVEKEEKEPKIFRIPEPPTKTSETLVEKTEEKKEDYSVEKTEESNKLDENKEE